MERRKRSTLTAAGTVGVLSSVRLGHATPHAVGLTHRQRVIATPHQHGAHLTDLPGPRFTPIASAAPFAVRGEEHRQIGAAARGTHPPLTRINGGRHQGWILRDRQRRIPIH
jgi:hypothetical protein